MGVVASHEGREVGRIITTAEELDALPPETGLLDARGAPWAMHTRFSTDDAQWSHREALIRHMPLTITSHPDDRIVTMRQSELKAHDAEVRAEALREAARVVRAYPSSHSEHVASILDERANRIGSHQ